jgi:hypothetical protein
LPTSTELRCGRWWVSLETDHTLTLLLLDECHDPVSSLGYSSHGVIYFIITILKLELCTCPQKWLLHNVQHVPNILDFSSKDTENRKSLIIYGLSPSITKLIAVLLLVIASERATRA